MQKRPRRAALRLAEAHIEDDESSEFEQQLSLLPHLTQLGLVIFETLGHDNWQGSTSDPEACFKSYVEKLSGMKEASFLKF